MNATIETIGKVDAHSFVADQWGTDACIHRNCPDLPREAHYGKGDWHERDNFADLDQAREYASFKSRQYPKTPYRIRQVRGRFVVEYVPEWKLR